MSVPSAVGASVEPGLVDRVRDRLLSGASGGAAPAAVDVVDAARAELPLLGDRDLFDVVAAVVDDLGGAGPLAAVLSDPAITDVVVAPDGHVRVDRGDGLEPSAVRLDGPAQVRRLAVRLAAAAGRRLDAASPWVDARLTTGARLHAVLPPVSVDGPVVSLRRPRSDGWRLTDLADRGAVTADGAAVLRRLARAGLPFLVVGAPGAGKTSVLGAMLAEAPPRQRLVFIEDPPELIVPHPGVVRLTTRPANVEGVGEVAMRDLVRQSLRMRPDRVVVGEVRGSEVVDLLVASTAGGAGVAATLHATRSRDVPARLEALALLAGVPRSAVHALLVAGLGAVVVVSRDEGRRRVVEVALPEVRRGTVVVTTAADLRDGVTPGPAYDALLAALDDADRS